MGEEVSRHHKVLAASVELHREVFTLAVDQLQTLANTLGIGPIAMDQLISRSNQPQHSLLNLLHDSRTIYVIVDVIMFITS